MGISSLRFCYNTNLPSVKLVFENSNFKCFYSFSLVSQSIFYSQSKLRKINLFISIPEFPDGLREQHFLAGKNQFEKDHCCRIFSRLRVFASVMVIVVRQKIVQIFNIFIVEFVLRIITVHWDFLKVSIFWLGDLLSRHWQWKRSSLFDELENCLIKTWLKLKNSFWLKNCLFQRF